jgi:hypothetical protein
MDNIAMDISLMKGEEQMKVIMSHRQFGYFWAVILGAGMLLGGCAATINYSYDPVADFSIGKNYSWASGSSAQRVDSLVEKNIRYYADQSLKEKGFTLTPDNPDFTVLTNCELEYSDPYKVRTLNLYVYGQRKGLIWQGTAAGTIAADAASPDLAETVKKILANFPPTR